MNSSKDVSKLISKLEIQIKRKLGGYFWGRHLSVFKGQGMNFKNIRQYQPGDEIRHIDWKVTARTGRVHVKEFEQESELEVYIILDISSSMFFGHDDNYKIHKLHELVNLLGQLLVKDEDKFGLIYSLDGKTNLIKPGKGYKQVKIILKEIAAIKPRVGQKGEIVKSITRFLEIHKRYGGCIIISDFIDYLESPEQLVAQMKKLTIKNEVFALQILDKYELDIGELSEVELEDMEDASSRKIEISKQMAEEYKEKIARLVNEFHLKLRKLNIHTGLIPTNSEAIKVLIKIFTSKKIVRL